MHRFVVLFGALLLFSTIVFAFSLEGAIATEFHTIALDDTTTIDVEGDMKFHLLYDGYVPASDVLIDEQTTYTRIRFNEWTFYGDDTILFIRVKNLTTNEYVYLDPLGPNTSITINDAQALGTYTLETGEHEIEIVPASSGALEFGDDFTFTLAPTSFIRDLLLSVFSGMATITFLVLFFVSWGARTRHLQSQQDHPTYVEAPKSVQDLYGLDDDDFFSKYDNK